MGRKQRNKQGPPPSFTPDELRNSKKRKLDLPSASASAPTVPTRTTAPDVKPVKLQKRGASTTVLVSAPTPIADAATDDFAAFDSADDAEVDEEDDEDDEEDEIDEEVAAERKVLFDSDDDDDEAGSEGEVELDDDEFDVDGSDVAMSDDDDGAAPAGERGLFSDSEDEEDLNAANMEAMSRKLDARAAEDAELAKQELQEVGTLAPQVLPDDADRAALAAEGGDEDLSMVATRLQEVVRVLADLKELGEPGRSRADYVAQFRQDVQTYFGYSEYLADRFCDFFPPQEALAFFEANETPRPIVIRVNTLKTTKRDLSKALTDRGVHLGDVGKWTKVALQIYESTVPVGATPEYMAGHYILQAASSLVPVLALAPGPGDKVLDMASAPGGKTSFLAQEMQNSGTLVANEVSRRRQKALVGNVVRMGCRNVVCVGHDGRDFGAGKTGLGLFDKVLLDAPCSGTGVIHKDPSIKTNRTEKDFQVVSQLQRQLLLSAIDSCRVGGVVVYSTCSIMPDEDEMVVEYALANRQVKLEPVADFVTVGEPGLTRFREKKFHKDMHHARRYYPHVHNMDGFFVARLRKQGKAKAPTPADVRKKAEVEVALASDSDDAAITSGADAAGLENGVVSKSKAGPFDEAEDAQYLATGLKQHMRRKGRDPRAAGERERVARAVGATAEDDSLIDADASADADCDADVDGDADESALSLHAGATPAKPAPASAAASQPGKGRKTGAKTRTPRSANAGGGRDGPDERRARPKVIDFAKPHNVQLGARKSS